jgi:FADH2 O2-dependent halogenase
VALSARLVVDASGPRGFLSRALELPEAGFAALPRTSALYAHFEGSPRLDRLAGDFGEVAPYPPDDAAVHHVFDGGWVWSLRFRSGIVSAGIAAGAPLAGELRLGEGEPAWRRLLARFPTLGARFDDARAVVPFVHARALPYRAGLAAGEGWALLPSAAAFVDPLLSTGFPLTLLGVERIARVLEAGVDSGGAGALLDAHGETTLVEADAAARLVAALWASFGDFELFAALTLLYFAAASYAEAARRLGRGHLAGGFLSHDRPDFGPGCASICEGVVAAAREGRLAAERGRWIEAVYVAIAPLDVVGLSDRSRRNWHPVAAEPLFAARGKLGATREEIDEMLARTEFEPLRPPLVEP